MTTTSTITNTATVVVEENTPSVLDQASRTHNRLFDYDATWVLARQGDEDAIVALQGEIKRRLAHIEESISNFIPTRNYEHKQNKSNIRQSARNYRAILDMLNQVGKELPIRDLNKIKNNKVLIQPHFGMFSDLDKQMYLIGMRVNGSKNKYRGIANFPMHNYGTFTMHEQGILFDINGVQHLLSTDEAHALIAQAMKRDEEARQDANLLQKGGQLTNEAAQLLRAELCHLQDIPYTQVGVFPNEGGTTASYDGYTLVIKEGTEFLTKEGQPITLEKTRISMEYSVYKALIFPVAVQRGLGTTKKYGHHQKVAEMIFGKGCNELPQTEMAMRQFNDLCYLYIRGANDTFYWKTEKEQEALFAPGTYLSRRHFTCAKDILYKYEECIAAYVQDQLDYEAERLAKKQASQAKQSDIVEDALSELDEDQPFSKE